MKLSFKNILPIILISALLILLAGCVLPDESPGYTPDEGEEECEDLIANAGGCYCATVCPDTDALIDLSGSASGTGPFSYAWDLDGDGSFDDSTLQNPQDIPFSIGLHTVSLEVTDDCDTKATATTSVDVSITDCINTAPKADIPPQAISAEGAVQCIPTYEFSGYAWDDEGDNLTYSFVGNFPAGMTIGENSGKIVWDPVCGNIGLDLRCHQCGTVCVTVRIQDDGCCGPLYTDVIICIDIFNGPVDGEGGDYVGMGFDGCPILDGFCNP